MELYKMDRTNTHNNTDADSRVRLREPIRESLILFVIKIASVLTITDTIYALLNFILLQSFFLNHALPFNLHEQAPYILTFLHIVKTVFQIWGITSIVSRWVGNSYQITKRHLIHTEGIVHCTEKIYDLNIIRSISIEQSWIGKIFKYGTVNIEISASGGYTDQVTLFGVPDPQQYENMLRKHF